MLRKLDLIGVQSDWGASQRGASMGPAAIRFGGLVEGLERQGHHVRDRGDILAPRTGASREKLLHYEQVSEVNRRVYLSVTDNLEEGRFPSSWAATPVSPPAASRRSRRGTAATSASSGSMPTATGTARRAHAPAICTGCPFPLSVVTDLTVWWSSARERRRLTWLTACRSADGTLTIWSGSVWRKRGSLCFRSI